MPAATISAFLSVKREAAGVHPAAAGDMLAERAGATAELYAAAAGNLYFNISSILANKSDVTAAGNRNGYFIRAKILNLGAAASGNPDGSLLGHQSAYFDIARAGDFCGKTAANYAAGDIKVAAAAYREVKFGIYREVADDIAVTGAGDAYVLEGG